ncbi:Transient receptor potential cation channel subfamily V member 4 [Amphibalanus amphitrite]|uniref:Transient receptor potential cation channel subfamily V member 4 n=1 Tax=Amphibalanus amphitrite TaxID=1232801 RepID=A0A6A4VL28_AMPAM|nr:Transient receptor potential cation channel subfamily V member 4 [Amphibalanus amphitrite]
MSPFLPSHITSPFQATVPSRVIFLLSCLLKLAMVVLRTGLSERRGGPYFIIYRSYQHPDGAPNPMKTPIQSVMLMFLASLNSFGDLYNNLKYTRQKLVGQILFILYMVCVAILLINMLIAMMGNTYQRIAEMKNEWMRQWARIVLVVERGVSPTYRLEHLNLYSKPMADGTPALILRKQQSVSLQQTFSECYLDKATLFTLMFTLSRKSIMYIDMPISYQLFIFFGKTALRANGAL